MKPFAKSIAVIYRYLNYLILDKRSLSLFRILLGLSILYNVIFVKWQYFHVILGADAFLPFELLDTISKGLDYSIFQIKIFRSNNFISFFKISYLIAAIGFTLGVLPRYMAIGILFFQFNIMQGANAFITGVDYLNLNLVFWAIFLPINEHFSVLKSVKNKVPSLAICFVLLLQIGCVYLFSALFKWGIPWKEGFAAQYMLMDTMNAWGLASFIRNNQFITEFINYSTILIELSIIALIFIKWKSNRLRLIAVILIIGFHSMILLCSDVSGFSFSGWAIAALLIPKNVWGEFQLKETKSHCFLSGWSKNIYIGLAVFASVVIVQRNFYSLYRSYNDTVTLQHLERIMIPSFAKSSFYHQYWTMFAPNPPHHIGSFGIVEKVKDIDGRRIEATYVYNSLDKSVNDWESAILYLLRQNIIELNTKEPGVNAFSFWLKWRIENSQNYTGNLEDYILIEKRKLVDLNNYSSETKDSELYYYAIEVINGNFSPASIKVE